MTETTELIQAIAVLEAQRKLLGDAVVDTAIAPMREKLAALEQGASRSGLALPAEHKLITILFADVVGSTEMEGPAGRRNRARDFKSLSGAYEPGGE